MDKQRKDQGGYLCLSESRWDPFGGWGGEIDPTCHVYHLVTLQQTGYSPRVLIFALQDTSSDTPLVILNEHTFGVRAVAFSPDQKYLASLGTANDGFLYVWSINQRTGAAKLHSSNKCTSFIKQMIWLGSSILT